jgi:hypothetical protein
VVVAARERRTYREDVRANLAPAVTGGAVFVTWLAIGSLDGSDGVMRYVATVPLLILGVVIANHHIGFSRGVLWCFVVWEAAHMAGGLIPFPDRHILYNVEWAIPVIRWDRLVHAFGFGVATAASWQGLRMLLPPGHGATRSVAFVAALCGLGFGALIEVFEFLMTLVIPTNVGDYVDTGWDLVFDTLGVVVVAVWLVRYRGPGRPAITEQLPSAAHRYAPSS